MLSKKTKYALHALTYLGKNRESKMVLIQDIAEEHGISHKFLENILLELKKAGLLGSKKGKGGGYYLIKEPKEIALSKVIRLLDGPIALLPCVSSFFISLIHHNLTQMVQILKVLYVIYGSSFWHNWVGSNITYYFSNLYWEYNVFLIAPQSEKLQDFGLVRSSRKI